MSTTIPFASYAVAAVFAVAIGMTLGGALIAVLTTRLIRAVSGLMICCIGLAGLYYFLNSPFLALMEILIYVGAVCVTIVFAIMLAEPDEPAESNKSRAKLRTLLMAIVSAVIGIGLARLALQAAWPAAPVVPADAWSVAAVGTALLTTYSLPFELISLVLLVAILGALVIARGGRVATEAPDASANGPKPAESAPGQPSAERVHVPEEVAAGH